MSGSAGSIPAAEHRGIASASTWSELLTDVLSTLPASRTAADLYEGLCRGLLRAGVVAVICSVEAGGRLRVLAHRAGAGLPTQQLEVPPSTFLPSPPRLLAAGGHPLASTLPGEIASMAAVVATVDRSDDEGSLLLSLFTTAADEGLRAAARPFAGHVAALLGRIAAEQRWREATARLEQQLRGGRDILSGLFDLAAGLAAAHEEAAASRLTSTSLFSLTPCDVAVAVARRGRAWQPVVSGRHQPAADLRTHIMAQVQESLAGLADDGLPEGEVLPPIDAGGGSAGPALALSGVPRSMLHAPVVAGGEVLGLLAVFRLEQSLFTPEQARLLFTVAGQYGAALERMQGARRAEQQRLAAVLDHIEHGIVLLDAGGSVLSANRAGAALLSLLSGELVDGEDSEVLSGADLLAELAKRAAAALGPVTREVIAGTDPARYVALAAAAIAGDGDPAAVALSLRDVTSERQLRERLFQTEKMVSVGQLVSGVAHELNNPLAAISTFAQLLAQRDNPPDLARGLQTIQDEAERASKIVQNLLAFARRRRPERVPVDLNSVVERVLDLHAYELRAHQIAMMLDLDPALPACLADFHQAQQVLLNLLTNAEQAVRTHTGDRRIAIRTWSADGFVQLSVADNGPGIARDHLRRVFDPFFTTKPVGEGTGLGLTITYGIVEEHGGRIDAENVSGGGARFTVAMPATTAVPVEPAGPAFSGSTPTQRRRILVVDDEPAIREALEAFLDVEGHAVATAANGRAAAALLDAAMFDAVITDIRMPDMDGMALYAHIQRVRPTLASHVIFCTGDTIAPETRAFVQQEGLRVIEKPFKLAALRDLVQDVLNG